ncbi:MAG: transposase, partial [Candidatus Altarchaeum sp.]|nr:transposase [Candidatus Altarchaeum sp.]
MSSQKRGNEGMDAAEILLYFYELGVYDHWKAYFKYINFTHVLCNVHHLRELTCAYEQDNCEWANELKTLLLEIKTKVDGVKEVCKQFLESDVKEQYRQKYFKILANALTLYPSKHSDIEPPKRGRKKQSKHKNLLDRLLKFEKETILFMEDFKVPFDNNLAERDI